MTASLSGVGLSPTIRRRSSSSQNFQAPYLAGREDLLGRLVADLHVVDAGLDAGVVDGPDEAVLEHVVVDQAAVADGAVQNLISGR